MLRTFSKAYGLAGLRVGFAVAPEPVADALRKTAVPFGVSGIAQQAAIESLRREEALLERVETLVAERDRVRQALLDQGWEVPVSEANFVWLALGDATTEFAAECDKAGVVVRAFPGGGVPGHRGRAGSERRVLADRGRVAQEQVLTCGRHPGFGGETRVPSLRPVSTAGTRTPCHEGLWLR